MLRRLEMGQQKISISSSSAILPQLLFILGLVAALAIVV
jgi:hypothetical protein